MKLAKTCIFCGRKPNNKTKEHVIPRWLIKLTGDPRRNVFLGYTKSLEDGLEERQYAFDQFTFPACDACNSKYAQLESDVKPIIIKLLSETSVLAEEISILLDWLDKVRIGLWLGMLQLNKNDEHVDPNFHIDTRISQYDRLLIIEKSDGVRTKLNMGGIDTFSFSITPSAFVLIINNYYFTNVSYMFLLSRRLGFPYPESMYIQPDDEKVEANFVKARERIMLPLLRKEIKEKGNVIYQPMFRGGLIDGDVTEYRSEYTRIHSMDDQNGIGNIFQVEMGKLKEYTRGDSLNVTPCHIHNDQEQFIQSAIHVCEWQNWLVQFLPKTDRLSREQKKYVTSRFKAGVKMNEQLIRHHKSLLQ